GHNNIVTDLGVHVTSGRVVSVSRDKTIKVWDLASGELQRTLRVPINTSMDGTLNRIALLRGGRHALVAGWTGYDWQKSMSLYRVDLESGELTIPVTGLEDAVMGSCMSWDGRLLGVTLGWVQGLRVYDINRNYQEIHTEQYNASTYACDFAAGGSLVTGSTDGKVRLYSQDFKLLREVTLTPEAIKDTQFSPDGSLIAVGFHLSPDVTVLNAKDLSVAYRPDKTGLKDRSISHVRWSEDGSRLLATGKPVADTPGYAIRSWSHGGRGDFVDWHVDDFVSSLQVLSSGDVVVGMDSGLARVTNGQVVWRTERSSTDMKGEQLEVLVSSHNGTRVGFMRDGEKVTFDVTERTLTEGRPADLQKAATGPPDIVATDGWENLSINGRKVAFETHEEPVAYAFHPEQKRIAVATNFYLRLYDQGGKLLAKIKQGLRPIDTTFSGDGEWLIVAVADGTLRWFHAENLEPALTLFPQRAGNGWVLWSPSGYYDAAPGSDRLIGWHLNNGRAAKPDFFPANLLRKKFYRPEIVSNVLAAGGERQALRIAEISGDQVGDTRDTGFPPVIEIIDPVAGTTFDSDTVTLRYRIDNRSGAAPVKDVRVLIDGRPAERQRGIAIVSTGTGEITVAVPTRDIAVALVADNRFGSSAPANVNLKWGGSAEDFVIKPKLYALAIGVSDYADDSLDLNYAAKDAIDFGRAVQNQAGGIYRDVEVRTLANASRDEVLDGLEWLERQTTSVDVAMLFLAGHGVNDDNGDFKFLPSDTDLSSLRRTSIPFYEIKQTLANLAGKAIAFVDTCHSGNIMGARRSVADINQVVNELAAAESGVIVFTSSTGRQFSLEDEAWGNGAFTKALVEGLSASNEFARGGRITINMLELYVAERVKALTGGRQTPTTTKP
ncbi:MAG: caspase family protein, partial [Pseudomonadales bacterium]